MATPGNLKRQTTQSEEMNENFSPGALLTDARYALRAVRKDLRLFAFAALIIGIGIGACTAIFSVMSPLMLRQLPFDQPSRLVWVANQAGNEGMSAITSRTSNLRDFRELSQSFEGLTGYFAFFESRTFNLVGDGEPERLVGVDVAQDFLEVLGVRPIHGRGFVEEEGLWGGPAAVVLDHSFWLRRFAGNPSIVGTSITLNNEPRQVVGILPPSFDFASIFTPHTQVDFLLPFPISDETDQWGNTISMIGRLKAGSSVESAQADLDAVIQGLQQADPERWGLNAAVSNLQDQISGPFKSALLLLAAAAGMVMLIVCVNLSNLLLAQASRRSAEMAVRSALGASRTRLIRQLLLESLALSTGGAIIGLIIATLTTRFVAGHSALDIPMLSSIQIDRAALFFTTALAILVGALVGLVPAIQITRREAVVFREVGRGLSASKASSRLREGLVIAEVALACVLLVFGGLLLKSFQKVLDVQLGFKPEQVVTWKLNSGRDFENLAQATAYFEQMIDVVEAVPGVEIAGLTDAIPLGRNRNWGIGAPGFDYEGRERIGAFPHIVDSRYLPAMEIPLLRGRQFTTRDTEQSPRVVILNESAARAIFKGEEALGRIALIGDWEVEVVGVVSDVRHRSLEKGAGNQMYLPYSQTNDFQSLDLVVRSRLPTDSVAQGVRSALGTFDPSLPTRDYVSLGAIVERAVSPRLFTLQLLSAFSSAALLLAALGIYGVLSFSVNERIREIGIRMALGETSNQVLLKVVAKTLVLASIGLSLGAFSSFALSRWARSLLYSVEPSDPSTFISMGAVLLLVSAVAGFIPAWRASQTNIVSVLKDS